MFFFHPLDVPALLAVCKHTPSTFIIPIRRSYYTKSLFLHPPHSPQRHPPSFAPFHFVTVLRITFASLQLHTGALVCRDFPAKIVCEQQQVRQNNSKTLTEQKAGSECIARNAQWNGRQRETRIKRTNMCECAKCTKTSRILFARKTENCCVLFWLFCRAPCAFGMVSTEANLLSTHTFSQKLDASAGNGIGSFGRSEHPVCTCSVLHVCALFVCALSFEPIHSSHSRCALCWMETERNKKTICVSKMKSHIFPID